MSKLSVKYLDAETGNYEYATVIDVGDLDKLKTTVKSDLVSAINSIGITGNIPSGIQDQIDEINQKIIDVKNSGLTDTQLAEVDRSISDGVGVLAGQLKALETKVIEDNAKLQSEISEDINTKLSNVETDYNAKVKTVSDSLDSAKTDISNVALDLSNTKNRLQNAETNAVTSESAVITIDEEPKLVIAKSFLILELHTENQKVTTLEIAPKGNWQITETSPIYSKRENAFP